MDIANIILDYIKVLIWPCLALFVIIRYSGLFEKFLKRLTEDTEEINSTYLGLSAKFRKDLVKLSEEIPNKDEANKELFDRKIKEVNLDQFRLLCSYFFNQPLHVRQQVANEVTQISKEINLQELLRFSESLLPGERVGAAIGLGVKIREDVSLISDVEVLDAIKHGLADSHSRVRYRYVEAISKNRALAGQFHNQLMSMFEHDDNSAIKIMAHNAVRNIKVKTLPNKSN